jgi:deoxyribodipyrimidine photolyase
MLATIITFFFMTLLIPVNSLSMQKPRIELFFQSPDDLRQRVQFLQQRGYKSFNIVNKNNKDTLLQWINIIRDTVPDSSICVHYSAKYNKSRKKDGAFEKFEEFMEEMNGKEGENEVLLITGSGEKGKFNSLLGLERLQSQSTTHNNAVPIAVAFNPFFPNKQDFEMEKDRLVRKLATNQVNKIYFQFGTDLQRLRDALNWIVPLCKNDNIVICGSIFLPTKKLINQQRFRPWNGVFLSQEFLESEQGARGIVLEMMHLYKSKKCELIIEAPGVRNEKDLVIVESLLKDQDKGVSTQKKKYIEKPSQYQQNTGGVSKEIKKRRIERISPSPLVASASLKKPAILLFGSHDVRLHDNVAFQLASFHGSVIPVFLWCKQSQGKWGVLGATEVVLKDALKNLDLKLAGNGLKLVCRSTDNIEQELAQLCNDSRVETVYWNKEHTTESRLREDRFKAALESIGVQAVECQSSLLYDPSMLKLAGGFNGGHWGTLMPFLKACRKQLGEPRRPIQRHETFALLQGLKGPAAWPDSIPVDSLDLAAVAGKDRWDEPILERFPISEENALQTMNRFFSYGFQRYEKDRSRADIDTSTSQLSAHLRLGTLSPNELYYKIEDSDMDYNERKTISRRLFWRDLAYFQLASFPNMREISIRKHYDETEWVKGDEEKKRFDAWKRGKTGYPLVDAGMRELWATGWMTQSVRMVVASFLTEYLRVDWTKGCEWFHYTLIDADSAINAMMWQNAGRSGIDQWNFVMSPVAASQDASGDYTRKWVPELSKLSKPLLHKPWEAQEEVLEQAGVVLGDIYPHRVVSDLTGERRLTVESVLKMRNKNQRFNDVKGYDLIRLPNGSKTVVFTKKEYRIDKSGVVIKAEETKRRKKADKGAKSKTNRGRRGRQALTTELKAFS